MHATSSTYVDEDDSGCMEHIRNARVHCDSGSKVEMTLTKHRYVAETRPSIFRKIFREKFVHVFRFFREKKGCEKCEKCEKNMSYFRLFRSDFNVSFAKMHCFRLKGLISDVIGIFKWL